MAAGQAASSGSIADGRGETDLLKLDPVVGAGWNADAAGQAGSRSVSRMQSNLCLNSRIHGSQSSCFACARVSSGALLGACVVGSASAAVGSACLPAVRTHTCADVAASACGGMAVMQRHACISVVSGGFLPVQKSTSYDVGTCRQGPTWRRCTKGGVSGPAEDLHPVPEVEAGVNVRPGGYGGRLQVHFPGGNQALVPGQARELWSQPSLHPEVPDSLSVSPGPGKRIRQLMGWTKVCGTTRSGIWVLKGIARTSRCPANLDHPRVEWMKRGSYKTAWVTPGHDCLCPYKYGHGAAVRRQTNNVMWDGVIGLWGRVAPVLSPWCGKKDVPTGVNLNHYDGSGSFIRWHSDNEPLFGPQNLPKLIISLSLGNSVEFMVRRRASRNVPSSITLNHGDVLVMDGSAQSEYLHCTMRGLQGPRVNLTYRWVAQHTASCPLAGVVGCLLPSCVQGLAEPGSRFWEKGENNWSFSWELAFHFVHPDVCSSGQYLDEHEKGASQQWPASILLIGALPLSGSCPLGGRTALATVATQPVFQKTDLLFPLGFFLGKQNYAFFQGYGSDLGLTAGYASSYEDAAYWAPWPSPLLFS